MGLERIGRTDLVFAWSEPRAKLRSDLIHRPGVGTSLGKAVSDPSQNGVIAPVL